jgi:hypothetical protein
MPGRVAAGTRSQRDQRWTACEAWWIEGHRTAGQTLESAPAYTIPMPATTRSPLLPPRFPGNALKGGEAKNGPEGPL